jgi:hypothetical protein
MPWLYLLLAGLCEMAWPLGFKYTNGFRSNYPAIGLTILIGLLSFSPPQPGHLQRHPHRHRRRRLDRPGRNRHRHPRHPPL